MSANLLTARYEDATATIPGDAAFWHMMLDESDNFSFKTARDGKGGPFGAQLWLVLPEEERYILVGTAERLQDSNAVVSKGIASAHAEAENLCLEKRAEIVKFLTENAQGKWHLVQVSSGESCQSCRAKQTLFAQSLIDAGLLQEGHFHVVFKATYDQTKRDAGFNDAPYDMTFRAIDALALLDQEEGLFSLEKALLETTLTAQLIRDGELIYTPVSSLCQENTPSEVVAILKKAGQMPCAVLMDAAGETILTSSIQEATTSETEKTAMIDALYQAAQKKRAQGVFASWDLEGAILYTNIQEIGPQAYAETLWCNLSQIFVIEEFTSDQINLIAREHKERSNVEMFRAVAGRYNSEASPLNVKFMGDVEGANIAHLYWKLHVQRELMLTEQSERMKQAQQKQIELISGAKIHLSMLVDSAEQTSHYNGKEAMAEAQDVA